MKQLVKGLVVFGLFMGMYQHVVKPTVHGVKKVSKAVYHKVV